jgi:hypothetical protein
LVLGHETCTGSIFSLNFTAADEAGKDARQSASFLSWCLLGFLISLEVIFEDFSEAGLSPLCYIRISGFSSGFEREVSGMSLPNF